MQEFAISFIISGLLAWIMISLYYYVRNKEIRAVQNALIDIYDFDKKMDIRYYRLRAIYALMVYKYHTCVTRPEFKYIVLGALVKQPWMKKFIREDLKVNTSEPLKSIAARLSLVNTISYSSHQDEISKFINDPARFEHIERTIKAVDSLMSNPDDEVMQEEVFNTLKDMSCIHLYVLSTYLFGINLPFSYFNFNPAKARTATPSMLRNAIYYHVLGQISPIDLSVDIHPTPKKRALYRERALSSGAMVINISSSDEACQEVLRIVEELKSRMGSGMLVTGLDLLNALGMADNFDRYRVNVINTMGENRTGALMDDRFPRHKALHEFSKLKITELSGGTGAVNAPDPLTPNYVTVLAEYSRIGRVYNKKSKESQD